MKTDGCWVEKNKTLRSYLISQDDRNKCVKKVELCHGDGNGDLEQRDRSESGRDELL